MLNILVMNLLQTHCLLDSHSDGTYSMQDPLVNNLCNTIFLQICSDEEKKSSIS